MKKASFDIDRRNFSINEEHVKNVGTYVAKVKIYKSIEAEISFEVVVE